MSLGVTIRLGATRNEVTTEDGRVFDRLTMSREDQNRLRRLIREAFEISHRRR